jgi:hypothetical protein
VVIVKWVGEACAQVSQKKEMVKRAFKRCGILVPIDGSNDATIKIHELETLFATLVATDLESEEACPSLIPLMMNLMH